MKSLVVKANGTREVRELATLEEMQAVVGGYIESVDIGSNILMVCNEEGWDMDLLENYSASRICQDIDAECGLFSARSPMILGDVFFCSAGTEDFEDITNDFVKKHLTSI